MMPNQSTVMGVALGYANSVYNTVRALDKKIGQR